MDLNVNLKARESSLFRARSAHGTTPSEAKLALRPNRPPEVRDQTPGMPDLAFFSRTMHHRRRARVERARAPPFRGYVRHICEVPVRHDAEPFSRIWLHRCVCLPSKPCGRAPVASCASYWRVGAIGPVARSREKKSIRLTVDKP